MMMIKQKAIAPLHRDLLYRIMMRTVSISCIDPSRTAEIATYGTVMSSPRRAQNFGLQNPSLPSRSYAYTSNANDNIQEAEFVEKGTKTNDNDKPRTAETQKDHAHGHDAHCIHDHDHSHVHEHEHKDEEDEDFSFLQDWYGSSPEEAYGRIIDTARLTAEVAYDTNGAVVGALAEAGGDEGAAERWLLGFWSLFTNNTSNNYVPEWWNDDHHQTALLQLANNRHGDHFIKRCVDPKKLKQQMGSEYHLLSMIALEVHMCITDRPEDNEKLQDGDEPERSDSTVPMPFDKTAIEQAKKIWGEETVHELNKKTLEEMREEQENSFEGMVQPVEQEEGEWWGAATNDEPSEAYHRLIDGARYGTTLAYEQGMDTIGAIADALQGHESSGLEEDEEQDKQQDVHYNPTELGFHAIEHFNNFLLELQGNNPEKLQLMPEWWNAEHEAALLQLAEDKDGEFFLGYPMDKEDVQERYDNVGVRQKVSLLADIAKQVGVGKSDMGDYDSMELEDEEHEDNDEAKSEKMEKSIAEDFSAMTVAQLKDQLRDRGLKVSGRKAELIKRLEVAD